MRELINEEMQWVAGGASLQFVGLEGYNFSFIVGNAFALGMVLPLFFQVPVVTAVGFGAAYAVCMMGAKMADNYYLTQPQSVLVKDHP